LFLEANVQVFNQWMMGCWHVECNLSELFNLICHDLTF
jgi:hypothetical protein